MPPRRMHATRRLTHCLSAVALVMLFCDAACAGSTQVELARADRHQPPAAPSAEESASTGAPDRGWVVGIGAAGEFELAGETLHLGGNGMVEWLVIDDWLELELELSVLPLHAGVEVPLGLLAKKPFQLT